MYIGVDIGGTKTLIAVLDDHGVIKEKALFPTPKTYEHFLLELKHKAVHLEHKDFKAGGVAIPGRVDREHGRGFNLGNLEWKNFNIQYDAQKILGCPVVIENDAKMAALSESMLLKDHYSSVLYVTISTGIGIGFVANGKIDTNIGDTGGRGILLEHNGKHVSWEDFAGGRAIVKRYGKKASEIEDEKTWRAICRDLAKGFIHLIAITEPKVIVIGGGVGTHFKKYGKILEEEVARYKLPMVVLPDFKQAQRPEEAVVYGCYDLAKQVYGHAKTA